MKMSLISNYIAIVWCLMLSLVQVGEGQEPSSAIPSNGKSKND